jgi:hypothetical protein
LAHPLSQHLAVYANAVMWGTLGSQGGPETAIARLAQLPYSALRVRLSNLPVRAAVAADPRSPDPLGSQTRLQTLNMPVRQSQMPGRFDLPQVTFLHLVQHLQPLPFAYAHADPLLFYRASRPLRKRAFSFCGDSHAKLID